MRKQDLNRIDNLIASAFKAMEKLTEEFSQIYENIEHEKTLKPTKKMKKKKKKKSNDE